MNKTTNYDLNKPAQTDFYDIDVQNENMDKIDEALTAKVDAVSGKGLSTNDYTTAEKNKLSKIAEGAEVNVQSDWSVTDTTSKAFIKNKPKVDTATSITSTNAVQNKVITAELNKKVNSVTGKGLSTNDYNATDKAKVDNLPSDTSTELGKKVNNQTFENHTNNTNIHTTSTEKEKWNKAISKVTGATSGNFASFDSDGGVADSKKKASDFLDSAHGTASIYGSDGVHSLRYYDDTLQVKNDSGEWVDVETGGGGIAPSNVSDLKIKVGNQKLTIFWNDPDDTVIEGQTLCTWKGTKLIQKIGAFPESVKDGTQLVDNQVRGAYATDGFTLEGLTNGTTYYFQLFPYSDQKVINNNTANQKSGTPQPYKKMTAVIDLSNSNPTSSVTYADDAVGMTSGSSDWDDFFGHYPVLLKDGVEVGKLNPDNFDQFEDGTTADISSGSAGDAMIAFPRRGLSISTSGTKVTISMTDDPDNNADYEYNAHTRGTTAKDVFYLGVYKGYVTSSKLRSLKGKTITASKTIGTFRTNAQANGTGYEQSGFYQLIFRQVMFILKYKTLDSQTAVGYGYVNSSHSAAIASGGTESYGMDSEIIKASNPSYMTDQNHHVKCFGIEDFWGNVYEWIDGLVTSSNRNILTANSSFNDSGSGYTDNGQGATADVSGYMSKPQGSTKTGFVAKEASGSSSTYFCDYAHLCASCVAPFGGCWNNGAGAGAFLLDVYLSASFSSSSFAARLMYL